MSAPSDVPTGRPALSVVIPAMNEAEGIGATLSEIRTALADAKIAHELIVVDDGSTDGTGEQARRGGARVIRSERNRGYGASLKRGIAAASADWIVIIDADGTYPAEAIPRLIERRGDADMVVGARTGADVHIPWERRPAKRILKALAEYLSGIEIPDLNSGLRLFRRDDARALDNILPSGFSFTTTITLAFACRDREIRYVPIDYRKRRGTSKIRARHFNQFLVLIVRLVVLFNPLRVFGPLAVLLFFAGAAKTAWDIWIGNLSESAVMAILAGIVILCVGLLADQNARLGLRPFEPEPRRGPGE